MIYYAHSIKEQNCENWQTLKNHADNVGNLAAEFARFFGAQKCLYSVICISLCYSVKQKNESQNNDHSLIK